MAATMESATWSGVSEAVKGTRIRPGLMESIRIELEGHQPHAVAQGEQIAIGDVRERTGAGQNLQSQRQRHLQRVTALELELHTPAASHR